MYNLIKTRIHQGSQFIPDIRKAEIAPPFRGFPELKQTLCSSCGKCEALCPARALSINPLKIDLGKCTFCGECERLCTQGAIHFTREHKYSADVREKLVVTSDTSYAEFKKTAIIARREIKKLFGKSLELRSVSAGGCNACEMELNACSNVNFDMGRFGIDIKASPRHADGLIITGPITASMASALDDAYQSTPDPKIVILMGSCAISGGLFADSGVLDRSFIEKIKPDLYIPGCPVHPLTFVNAVLDFIGHS